MLAPAKSLAEMQRVVTNDYVDATMCALFMAVVVSMLVYGAIATGRALGNPTATAKEVGGDLRAVRSGA